MRRGQIAIWGCVAVAAATAIVAGVRPSDAASALRPEFTVAICNARAPRLAHAWVQAITVAPSGMVIPAAAAAISNADHAELLFKLGLLEGHLMVAQELIDAKQPRLALPHFGHPVRELYDDISDELHRRGISGFDGELVSLEAFAAGKPNDPAFGAQYGKVIGIVAAIRATVPAGLLDSPPFMLGVLGEIAATAAEEYSESIEGGRIEKPIEYHDSRGYLAYADKELRRLEARPEERGTLVDARAKLTELQAIVGPLLPPERPSASVAAYKAIVVQFKQAALPRA